MTAEITTNKTFQERMFEKVRDQMGDLLTETELKQIVDQAVNKAFFEPRKVSSGGYREEIKPAVFVEMMENELRTHVREALDKWMASNKEIVAQTIEKVIQEGITRAVMQTLESRMSWPLQNFAEQLRAKGVFA